MATQPQKPDETGGAVIHRLRIERFRGVQLLDWRPKAGLNVILGAGDSGKTTILDAIGLLLSPTNATVLSEADYWARDRTGGFMIGAVVSLPASSGVNSQRSPLWPWEWTGKEAKAPTITEDGPPAAPCGPPVYKLCVVGTEDLDLIYEVRGPNGVVDTLSPNLRREIGLVRLSGDDRNDRDLRLVQGSALDRLLSDPSLRSRLGAKFADADVRAELSVDAQTALTSLDAGFADRALPHDLGLGLNAGQGQSVSALIGLTAAASAARLPLASWGAGTRRLASLAIAQACRTGCPVTLVDEAERGLEPYRQRKLVADLKASPSQVFMTTHSAPALAAAEGATLWHMTANGAIGALAGPKISRHQRDDPETFLARLAIIGEGVTEVGFLRVVLARSLPLDLLDLGVKLCDAGGNATALGLLQEMADSQFEVAALVDDEGDKPAAWTALKARLQDRLLQWPSGCTESVVIDQIPEARLADLIIDPDGELTQARLDTLVVRLKHLHPEADLAKHDLPTITALAGAQFKALVIAAASGATTGAPAASAKTWKKQAKLWFKSETGGAELADKAYRLGAIDKLAPQLAPFIAAVAQAVGTSVTSPSVASDE